MSSMNTVVLSGRLTRDLETKTLQNDKSISNGAIALNRKFKDSEQTSFVEFKAWDKLGINLGKYTKKGSRVNLKGRLEQETWEKDGKNFSKLLVVVEDFELLDKREDNE